MFLLKKLLMFKDGMKYALIVAGGGILIIGGIYLGSQYFGRTIGSSTKRISHLSTNGKNSPATSGDDSPIGKSIGTHGIGAVSMPSKSEGPTTTILGNQNATSQSGPSATGLNAKAIQNYHNTTHWTIPILIGGTIIFIGGFVYRIYEFHQRNWKDKNNKTPLHYAVEYGRLDNVKDLLNDVNCLSKIFRYIFVPSSYINTQDKNGDTPLTLALKKKYEDIAIYLINNKNLDINIGPNGKNPITLACKNHYLKFIKAIYENEKYKDTFLQNNRYIINSLSGVDNDEIEPVAEYIIKKFLEEDTNWNEVIDDLGNTPLHLAIKKGLIRVVDILIENEKNINHKAINSNLKEPHYSGNGNTPLIELIISTKLDLETKLKYVNKLLEKGADPNILNKNLDTPLHTLVKSYEQINDKNDKKYYHQIIVNLIQTGKVNVDRKDKNGDTALFIVARYGNNLDTCEILLQNGANKEIVNNKNETIKSWFKKRSYTNEEKTIFLSNN